MILKFTAIHNTISKEVFPIDTDKLSLDKETEDEQIFFRKKLNGKLLFINDVKNSIDDYDYFYAIESNTNTQCDEITLEIEISCDGVTFVPFWQGYFSTNEGEFDLNNCTFSVEPKIDDGYRCILDNSEREFNLSSVSPTIIATANIFPQYEYYTCRNTPASCSGSLPAPGQWLLFHTDVVDGVTTSIYYREIAVLACQAGNTVTPSGSGWVLKQNDCASTGLCYWVRTPQTVYTNNPNPYVSAGNCIFDGSSSYYSTAPPRRARLAVTKQSTPDVPVIVGKSKVLDNAVSHHSDFYYVKYPKENATYLWTVSGAGISIVGSATGTYVEVDINFSGIGRSVSVVETTLCGASAMATQNLTTCSGSGCSEYNSEVKIMGNDVLCSGETCKYYFNAQTGQTAWISGSTGTGHSINIITNSIFEITAGTAGSITVGWFGGGATDSLTIPTKTITVVDSKKNIEDIFGAPVVCAYDETKYSIPETDLGGYTWTVEGGTITSGQGTHEITVEWDGNNGTGYVYCAQNFNCGCNWVQVSECGASGEPSYWFCPDTTEITYSSAKLLKDVFGHFLSTFCNTLSLVSDFFEWNPVGDAPGYIAGNNYVTGVINKVANIGIEATENIIGTTNGGIKDKLTLKDLNEMLRLVFNVYWFIDGSVLRYEHISYFQRTLVKDLTTSNNVYYKNIFSYNKTKMPKYERFTWANALNTDFVGAEIWYDSVCVSQDYKTNTKGYDVNDYTTDLLYIYQNPSDISKDGFTLLCLNAIGSTYVVDSEQGLITGQIIINAHLSWANLHYNYHRHERVLLQGYMNLALTNFITKIKSKQQENVEFSLCCDEDIVPETDLVKTEIGNGVIAEYSWNLRSSVLKLKLLF